MPGLFSCFRSSKKRHSSQYNSRLRRVSREANKENVQIYYVEPQPQPFTINNENKERNENVKTSYYKQSKSYPASPERNSLYKVYSFDQRSSLEKQRAPCSKSVTVYAADNLQNTPLINENETSKSNEPFPYEIPPDPVPRRSRLSYGVNYEEDLLSSSPKYNSEKNAESYGPNSSRINQPVPTLERDRNNLEDEKLTSLQRSRIDDGNLISNSPKINNDELLYINNNGIQADHVIKSIVRARPLSHKRFSQEKAGPAVMIYQAQPKGNNPMMVKSLVRDLPLKESKSKRPNTLTTADGRVFKPIGSEKVRRSSLKSEQGMRIVSGIKPLEQTETFPLTGSEQPVYVTAPMIGGNRRAIRSSRKNQPQSILRKGGMSPGGREFDDGNNYYGPNQYAAAPPMGGRYGGSPYDMDDYNDPYGADPYNADPYGADPYGADLYGADPYGADPYGGDMYGARNYFAPVGDQYGRPGPRNQGAYGFDDDISYVEETEGYGRGMKPRRRGPPIRQQQAVYAAQMPDVTLPDVSPDKGKNPPFKKNGKPAENQPSTSIAKGCNSANNEQQEETQNQSVKESRLKLACPNQSTDALNGMDFICFSPEKFIKNSSGQTEPGSKLRWRIIIKRGDEE